MAHSGSCPFNSITRTIIMYAPDSPKSSTSPKRRSSFAADMARDAFGRLGHLHDNDWRDHNDISAEQLAQKRKQVLWSGVAS